MGRWAAEAERHHVNPVLPLSLFAAWWTMWLLWWDRKWSHWRLYGAFIFLLNWKSEDKRLVCVCVSACVFCVVLHFSHVERLKSASSIKGCSFLAKLRCLVAALPPFISLRSAACLLWQARQDERKRRNKTKIHIFLSEECDRRCRGTGSFVVHGSEFHCCGSCLCKVPENKNSKSNKVIKKKQH